MDYITIKKQACSEFVEKKSRFIAAIRPVVTKEQADAFVQSVKSEHWNAAHNVHAYVLRSGQMQRYCDDGEPQGTAGVPVLNVLQKEKLTDLCVVVTRYFGGVLLGAGGLVRAYSHACKLAIDASQIVQMCACEKLMLHFAYSHYGKVGYLLLDFEIKILHSDFSETVTITLLVQWDQTDLLQEKLIEATCGQIEIHKNGEVFSEFPHFSRKI